MMFAHAPDEVKPACSKRLLWRDGTANLTIASKGKLCHGCAGTSIDITQFFNPLGRTYLKPSRS